MATDNIEVGTAYTRVIDASVVNFTLSAVEPVTWEVALFPAGANNSVVGHRVKDSDLQVTRMIGSGNVYARSTYGTITLVRTLN
jgi:hypothetical protein